MGPRKWSSTLSCLTRPCELSLVLGREGIRLLHLWLCDLVSITWQKHSRSNVKKGKVVSFWFSGFSCQKQWSRRELDGFIVKSKKETSLCGWTNGSTSSLSCANLAALYKVTNLGTTGFRKVHCFQNAVFLLSSTQAACAEHPHECSIGLPCPSMQQDAIHLWRGGGHHATPYKGACSHQLTVTAVPDSFLRDFLSEKKGARIDWEI